VQCAALAISVAPPTARLEYRMPAHLLRVQLI
jgi:hypothetical protein